MVRISQENSITKELTFRAVVIRDKQKTPTGLYQDKITCILHCIKNLLEDEINCYAVEILRAQQQCLKLYLPQDDIDLVTIAVLYLLTKQKKDFLCMGSNGLKHTFGDCPFKKLQELAELSEVLRSELSDVYKSKLLMKKKFRPNQIKSPNYEYIPLRKKILLPGNFDKPLRRNKSLYNGLSLLPMTVSASSQPAEKENNGLAWLNSQYVIHKHLMPGLSNQDFIDSVVQLLASKKDDNELQNEFIEMLGFDLFELIADILNRRKFLLQSSTSKSQNLSVQHELPINTPKSESLSAKPEIVNHSSKIETSSLMDDLEKLVQRVLEYDIISDTTYRSTEEENQMTSEHSIKYTSSGETLNQSTNIHDQRIDVLRKMMVCGRVTNVPYDAISKHHELYDEITIPPKKLEIPLGHTEKVHIDMLDDIGKMAFKDIKSFNYIQSEVFNIAYNSNENMLVCAPTGSGKTNIALMTVVNQVKRHIIDGVLHLDKFKIVYICPMKALAAEMTQNFSKKLACLNINVRELTGDMQMTRKEILETQMIVTTPEKWDIISRKGTADLEYASLVKLLIIDEVHLLNTDRGPVIEALVARTLRLVISSQNLIRIVGLSATLPSYTDVAQFLRVNPRVGLFFFDNRYRSVPLIQTFVGMKSIKSGQAVADLEEACFDKVVSFLKEDHQVLVFVHARNQTIRTANFLKDAASKRNLLHLFAPPDTIQAKKANWDVGKNSTVKVIAELLAHGLGIHHAGMLRHDRSTTEKNFLNGTIKVLVCTATLAWGVNLPAHGVIIKGTEMYDSKRGSFVDLDILDVLQIFGRAGRPQFDTSGHGIIITSNEKVTYYLSALTNQLPIESNLMKALPDHLNAEVVLGTVSNIQEAVEWLTFTYMYKRMRVNPHIYGLLPKDLIEDPSLRGHLLDLCHKAAEQLDKAHMIRYDMSTGELIATYLGRTASYYYITLETIEQFNEKIHPFMTESDIIYMMCSASEFSDMQVRPEELDDLDFLLDNCCEYNVPVGVENTNGKVFVLMQTYLSRGYIKSISLASDMAYINQSIIRIVRALFDIAIHQNNATLAGRCLSVAQAFEQQMWPHQSPVRQFPNIPITVIEWIESNSLDIQHLKEVDIKDLGHVVRNHHIKNHLKRYLDAFPSFSIESSLHPITRGVLRVKLFITPTFKWNDKIHGKGCENFWLWVEDPENDIIYHSENLAVTKAVCMKEETLQLVFTVPLIEPYPSQYLVRVCSDRWMHAVHVHALSFRGLHIPSSFTPHTELLQLHPLSVEALENPFYEEMYNFSHFNPVQTQIFHTLYHRDVNILLGAPTGSGKTIAAEICIFRLFNKNPKLKVVYIAPLKALVRERVEDWKQRFYRRLHKNVVEMTGDVTPSMQTLKAANIIITTPEKWDGLSRGWQNRRYIQEVGLIIIDEIHLLGEDRGPVLEVIVSRTNFINNQTGIKPRIIGLSTAMANAGNLANWLDIREIGLYNFRPSVRPVPLEAHIMGFPGKHYCPRMLSMNKPTYQAIRQFAPHSPSLIFCSSRKQTRLTAIDLITFLLTDAESKRWLNCDESVMSDIVSCISDADLKHFLMFGIGIHHAGLQDQDRKTVEELFVNQKIQVLIATATLAWGVNFPAHLVVIKGTEYFDGKTKRYIDMPITDVLQMMGRAGRPQFDSTGVACVFVQDVKKNFYKKFLYEPFPIESNLMQVLPDHVNAEIASGMIASKDNLMEYMTWTYFFRRLLENPSYYNLDAVEPAAVQEFLTDLVDAVVNTLVESNCVIINDDPPRTTYEVTFFGQVASYYYLSHKTLAHFQARIKYNSSIMDLLHVLCSSEEYALFPVRHNEDKINKELAEDMAFNLNGESCESPSIKVALLINAYLTKFPFPNQEYTVDFKSAMDQALRILQGMVDTAASSSWLGCTLRIIHILQMLIQGQHLYESPLLTIPHVTTNGLKNLATECSRHLKLDEQHMGLLALKIAGLQNKSALERVFSTMYSVKPVKEITSYILNLPLLDVNVTITQTGQTWSRHKMESMVLNANEEHEFLVKIRKHGSPDLTVHAPRFPKKKEEGWFICVGDIEHDYLIQIKRLTIQKQSTCSLMITAPIPGNYIFTIFLMSDSYLGIDQQFDIPVTSQL